jgi:2-polyprenyl-6-methoxyphenol hydroxylase-like FAD-dependent oxidoreductase
MDGKAVRRHRVAIVGGGFGGLFAAKRRRCAADVDVTVSDRTIADYAREIRGSEPCPIPRSRR